MFTDEFFLSPHNYCDYRCEKCSAKNHCSAYKEDDEDEDDDWEMFDPINDSMGHAVDIIRQVLEKNDIDMVEIMEDEDEDDSFENLHQLLKEKIPLKLCFDYLDKTAEFLDHYRSRYVIPSRLGDAFQDLAWYLTVLPAKIERTLRCLHSFGQTADEYDLMDAYFTSMVVYKSLWKSYNAVQKLKDTLVDYQEILTELETLQRNIKIEFKHEFPFEILVSTLDHHIQQYKNEKKAKKVKKTNPKRKTNEK
ncbi:MAG: hypothetical protein GY950_34980 [bacterium]|nr:hypothetical protein [bacterium]